jgi:hypothetical protein
MQQNGEVSARWSLPPELDGLEQAATLAKWEPIADAPTELDSKFYRGTAEGHWSFTIASFDLPHAPGARGFAGAVVKGFCIVHLPPASAKFLFELAERACSVQDAK